MWPHCFPARLARKRRGFLSWRRGYGVSMIFEPRAGAAPDAGGAEEDADARHNRQLIELLNELRVAIPGVQMLFGFLLAVPFSSRFGEVSADERVIYFGTFLATAAASVCLIAPTSFHRIVWRRGRKHVLLHIANILALAGTGFLALAITGAVTFVATFLYGTGTAVVAGGVTAGALIALWYVLPLGYRISSRRTPRTRP